MEKYLESMTLHLIGGVEAKSEPNWIVRCEDFQFFMFHWSDSIQFAEHFHYIYHQYDLLDFISYVGFIALNTLAKLFSVILNTRIGVRRFFLDAASFLSLFSMSLYHLEMRMQWKMGTSIESTCARHSQNVYEYECMCVMRCGSPQPTDAYFRYADSKM